MIIETPYNIGDEVWIVGSTNEYTKCPTCQSTTGSTYHPVPEKAKILGIIATVNDYGVDPLDANQDKTPRFQYFCKSESDITAKRHLVVYRTEEEVREKINLCVLALKKITSV